ncbi:MAG: hypothetical protein M1536_00540, partial [Firmicutes bacterium]|nr:hypothetical protein [Bacillota bacterium]
VKSPDLNYSAIDAARDFKSLKGRFPSDNNIEEFCRELIGGAAIMAADQYGKATVDIFAQVSDVFNRTDSLDKTIDIVGKERIEKARKWASEALKYYSIATEFCSDERRKESRDKIIQIENTENLLKRACEKPKGCFIATACFDSPDSAEVIFLRDFRDNALQKSYMGQIFIRIYYAMSPPLAMVIQRNRHLKRIIREIVLLPLISFLKRLGLKDDD